MMRFSETKVDSRYNVYLQVGPSPGRDAAGQMMIVINAAPAGL